MKFLDKKTNEVKDAYSIKKSGDRVLIKFQKDGKEYSYNLQRVELLEDKNSSQSTSSKHRIYKFCMECYNCHRNTSIYTYIVFSDTPSEDVIFPWNKKRLLRKQDLECHMRDPSIEYYGLQVIGENDLLDEVLAKNFSHKIKIRYSSTQNRTTVMNICDHCKAKQGEYFVYRAVNKLIKEMKEIDWFEIDADLS